MGLRAQLVPKTGNRGDHLTLFELLACSRGFPAMWDAGGKPPDQDSDFNTVGLGSPAPKGPVWVLLDEHLGCRMTLRTSLTRVWARIQAKASNREAAHLLLLLCNRTKAGS